MAGPFFSGFRANGAQPHVIWTNVKEGLPYVCTRCRREFGLHESRWLANSMRGFSQKIVECICDDCKNGIDPHRRPMPNYSKRRTTLPD